MIYNKKSLGQNFLIDNNIKRKIVNSINIKDKDVIDNSSIAHIAFEPKSQLEFSF